MMMASSKGTGEQENASGVIGGHAYSVISAHEITDRNGQQVKLLKLMNPWGDHEWKGDWSDKSPLWIPQLKQQLGVRDADDGVFFISF